MIVLLNDTRVDGAAELKTITEDSAEWKKCVEAVLHPG